MNKPLPITSREYKLILKAQKFQDRAEGIKNFWEMARTLINDIKVKVQTDEFERQTWYLDTLDFALREQHKVVLRLRESLNKDDAVEYKLTLKHRDSDRTKSAAQNISVNAKGKVKSKFEEDIVPSTQMFAHSTSIKLKKLPTLSNMEAVVKIFPGLATLGLPNETLIETVHCRRHELVQWVGTLKLGEGIKMCLSFWYASAEKTALPNVVEFSFDYDSSTVGQEQFDPQMEETAILFFEALQQQADWVDLNGTTKTAFAYATPCPQGNNN